MLSFLKRLFREPLLISPPPLKEGDKFLDKEWGDIEIEIIKISKSGEKCRYKFNRLEDGRSGSGSSYSTSCDYVLSVYEKAP